MIERLPSVNTARAPRPLAVRDATGSGRGIDRRDFHSLDRQFNERPVHFRSGERAEVGCHGERYKCWISSHMIPSAKVADGHS
jgi:hypothetical protein